MAAEMQTIRYALDPVTRIATATLDEPGSPVNTMTAAWQADMAALADRLEAERPRGLLLESAKTTFFAGAALREVLKLREADAPRLYAEMEALKATYRRLDRIGLPVVALLEGAALGGGWELALAAHARFALDDPKIQLGLPEVTLGLIAGSGGITRMTRLLGFAKAQPHLLEGRLMSPRDAAELGLVHGLAATRDELRAAAVAFIEAHPQVEQPWDRKGYRIPGGGPQDPEVASMLSVAPAVVAKKTRGLQPAVQATLEAMVEGARVDFDTATRIESRKLAKVTVTQTARNMIQCFFFDLQAVRAGKARPGSSPRWKPSKVGILGAGMMGSGIAHACAASGIACVLHDASVEKAEAGRERAIAKGRRVQPELIGVARTIDDLRGSALIVEAVHEQRELKAQVTRDAEPMLAADGVLATNTSTLPIGGLAKASGKPSRFVGMHFFSPVEKMKLVEIIRGPDTDDDTVAKTFDAARAMGKLPIVVRDGRGFFTSRVFGAYVMEAVQMLADGIAAPLIEHAALAAGFPVGPLAVLDETSLALSMQVIEQTRADFAAEGRAYRMTDAERLVERMVREFQRPGRASGGGFYDYPTDGPKRLWPGLAKHLAMPGASADIVELKDRLLYRGSIETVRCRRDGMLATVYEANVGSVFGIGFPAWTGGALQFVDSVGIDRFVERARELAGRHDERFAVDRAQVEAAIHR